MKVKKTKKGIYRNGQKLNWKHNILFYGCDLETTTINTKYYERTKGTTVYAISLMRVPVYFHAGKGNYEKDPTLNTFEWLKQNADKTSTGPALRNNLFGKIDQIWNYFLNDIKVGRSTIIYLYFHNGQKWDYTFIYEWCKNAGWENIGCYPHSDDYDETTKELIANSIKSKLKQTLKEKKSCYGYSKSNGWVSLTVYLYHPKGYHIKIEFRDSFKLLTQSIKSIGHDFFSKDVKGNYYQDLQTNPWYLALTKHWGEDCLSKHELDVNAVQDVKDNIVYYDDKTNKYEYDLTDSKKWPQMIKERVSTDTIILCFALGYGLVNGIWTVLHSDKVPQTTGASAIYFFASMLVDKNNPDNIRNLVINKKGEHKGKINDELLWTTFYNCEQKIRVSLERWMGGKQSNLELNILTPFLTNFNKKHHCNLILNSLPVCARGGFTEGLPSIKGKILAGNLLSFDVNSEYPFGATHPLPYGEPTYLDEIPKYQINKWWTGWFYVKHIKMKYRCIQPIFRKEWSLDYHWTNENLKDGLLTKEEIKNFYQKYPKDEKYVYELTDAIIPWAQDEYQTYLINHPECFEVEDFWPIIILSFNAKPWAKRFMEENYKIKEQASKDHNNTMKLSAKLKLNSLTGKLSQKYIQSMSICLSDYPDKTQVISMIKQNYEHWKKIEGEEFEEEINEKAKIEIDKVKDYYNLQEKEIVIDVPAPCNHAYVPGYSAITSKGRALIHGYSLDLAKYFNYDETKIRICYSDTDSLKIWTKDKTTYDECLNFVNDNHWLDDTELGKLKEEFKGKVKYFKYLCPKKYLVGNEKQEVILSLSAFSGLKKDELPDHLMMNDIAVLDVKPDMKPKQIEKNKKYCPPYQNTFKVLRPIKVPGGVILKPQDLTIYSFLSDDKGIDLDEQDW